MEISIADCGLHSHIVVCALLHRRHKMAWHKRSASEDAYSEIETTRQWIFRSKWSHHKQV